MQTTTTTKVDRLTVVLVVKPIHNPRYGHNRYTKVTQGIIKAGPVVLATSVDLPGIYTESQMINQYRINPGKFRVTDAGKIALPRLLNL